MVHLKDIAIVGLVVVLAMEGRKILEYFKPKGSVAPNITFPDIVIPEDSLDANKLAETISNISLGTSRYAFDFVAGYTTNLAQSGYEAISDVAKYGYDSVSKFYESKFRDAQTDISNAVGAVEDFYSEKINDMQNDTSNILDYLKDVWGRANADRSGAVQPRTDQEIVDIVDRYQRAIDAGTPAVPLLPDGPKRPNFGFGDVEFTDHDVIYDTDATIIDRALRDISDSSGSSGDAGAWYKNPGRDYDSNPAIEYGTGGRTAAERALERTRAADPTRDDWTTDYADRRRF